MLSFQPLANTAALTVGTVSEREPLPFPASLNSWTGDVLVANTGPQDVFMAFGDATVVAAIPVPGTPANGIIIIGNSERTFWVKNVTYAACIAITGQSNNVYVTAGVNQS